MGGDLCCKWELVWTTDSKFCIDSSGFQSTKRGQASKVKAEKKWTTDLCQPHPQPTYNTNPNTRKYKRFQLGFLSLNGVRDQTWYPWHVGKNLATEVSPSLPRLGGGVRNYTANYDNISTAGLQMT
jgi:hypothetical protein